MNGPKIWDPILTACAAVYGSAVVAGGSVRDWNVHKNIKPRDIDVFVPADELDLELGIWPLRETFDRLKLLEPDMSEYAKDELQASNINGVLEGTLSDWVVGASPKVNIIAKAYDVYDTDRLFADFDHSLCQFAYTGEQDIVSADARSTLDTGNVIVYNPSRRTKVRLDRLVDRRSYSRFVVDWSVFPPEEPKLRFSTGIYTGIEEFNNLAAQGAVIRNNRVINVQAIDWERMAPAWGAIQNVR